MPLENRSFHDVGPFGNNVYVISDPDIVPDVAVFADGVAEALAQLGAIPAD